MLATVPPHKKGERFALPLRRCSSSEFRFKFLCFAALLCASEAKCDTCSPDALTTSRLIRSRLTPRLREMRRLKYGTPASSAVTMGEQPPYHHPQLCGCSGIVRAAPRVS